MPESHIILKLLETCRNIFSKIPFNAIIFLGDSTKSRVEFIA